MFAAMYSQMKLLKGIIIDRHTTELVKSGSVARSVVVPPLRQDQPFVPVNPSEGTSQVDLKPPNIFERRKEFEDEERKRQKKIQQELGQLPL